MFRELSFGIYFLIIFGLVAGNIFIYQEIFAPKFLEVAVLEVGKGSAILIQTPNRKTILIDTGSDASILRALGMTLPEWKRNIDAVLLTNTKSSAVGGLSEIMSHYRAPSPINFGTAATPYGTKLTFDDVSVSVLSPGTLTISYGASSFSISSSTPKGVYTLNGKTFVKTTN